MFFFSLFLLVDVDMFLFAGLCKYVRSGSKTRGNTSQTKAVGGRMPAIRKIWLLNTRKTRVRPKRLVGFLFIFPYNLLIYVHRYVRSDKKHEENIRQTRAVGGRGRKPTITRKRLRPGRAT